ncbi:unnamed protein product, partial [Ectocarpus sp. 13 AM-2016]
MISPHRHAKYIAAVYSSLHARIIGEMATRQFVFDEWSPIPTATMSLTVIVRHHPSERLVSRRCLQVRHIDIIGRTPRSSGAYGTAVGQNVFNDSSRYMTLSLSWVVVSDDRACPIILFMPSLHAWCLDVV